MTGDLRKQWHEFKKKHPNFEKHRGFKSDVGPQLDKFDKARDEYWDLMKAAEKKQAECVVLGKAVAAALKGYDAVAQDLRATDKSIMADMAKGGLDAGFYNCYVKPYTIKMDWGH